MANNSVRLRSLLKTPNSPRRSNLNVSFDDQHINSSLETSKSIHSHSFSSGHSHSLTEPPDSVSFLNGSSVEEVTCPDIDDLLPKTDYTYTRTASYRTKYLKKIRSVSPNMSRRRVDGSPSIFISDDESEDGYGDEIDDEAIIANSRNFYSYQAHQREDLSDNHSNAEVKKRRSAINHKGYTSTPVEPHNMHHISVHDHYYNGMLLRSGSHIKGARKARRFRDSSSSLDAFSQEGGAALVPTYRSDYDEKELRGRNRNQNSSSKTIKTTTTTTTIHTYEDDDEGGKQMLNTADDDEMKLKYDESQSEKMKNTMPYVLHSLDGLDVEEDVSDVESYETERSSYRGADARRQQSNQNFLYTLTKMIITTIITTTTTVTESVSSVMAPVVTTMAKPVTVPASWLWRAIVSSCSWILRQSATILLIEMESKHRRRRGCCVWFLPFLLLLPLALLAGHYAGHMKHHVGSFMSESEAAISGMWVGFWSERQSRVVVPPTPPQAVVSQVEKQEVDMTQINQYIQQTVLQIFNEHQQTIPPGLTEDQVKKIVQAMLLEKIMSSQAEIGSQITRISDLLQEDMSKLKKKLLVLQTNILESNRATQTVAENLDETKASFNSMSGEQKMEWLVATQKLESKFLDLRNDVNGMVNQNTALVAMLKSCCQNNTALAGTIRSHMISILSEMGSDDKDSALGGLMSWMQANYVEKAELDKKLSQVASEITENLNSILAERIAAEVKNNGGAGDTEIKASIVSASIDENVVKSIVEEALVQFSADRVGMPDFALESAGGSVLSVRCSETYYRKTALVSVFGVPLYYTSNSPRTVIQPNVHPGECWAFKGSSGFVVIQLSQLIQPTGFTLEHIPRSLAPSGTIDSAPRSFSVIGLASEGDTEGINLGNYTYVDNGKPIQHFPIQNKHPGMFQYVELKVMSNHGNPEYTCIYRFRVHGLP